MDLVGLFVGVTDWSIDFGASVLQIEVGKLAIAFVIAERIHRRSQKKDVDALISAIDKLGTALGHRLDSLEERVTSLEKRD